MIHTGRVLRKTGVTGQAVDILPVGAVQVSIRERGTAAFAV